jgi:hypothetical protein
MPSLRTSAFDPSGRTPTVAGPTLVVEQCDLAEPVRCFNDLAQERRRCWGRAGRGLLSGSPEPPLHAGVQRRRLVLCGRGSAQHILFRS